MVDKVDGLSGKVGLDVTDYKAGVTEINRQIRVIESGFKASAAALGDWDKTATGLEKRIGALSKEITLQKNKVTLLTAEYKKIATEKGKNSRAAQDLQIKINKETESLNKMDRELKESKDSLQKVGKETKETGKEIKTLGDKAEKTEKQSKGLHGVLSGLGNIGKIGGKIIAGLAVSVVALGVGLGGLITKFADISGELVDTALKTGISVERLQELDYIGSQVGTDVEVMTTSLSKLTKGIGQVGKNKDTTATFRSLGVSVRDAKGELRDSEDVFFDTIDALGKVKNETQRDIISNQLFGKSYQELNPLIKAGGAELKRLATEARASGAVMSEEVVANYEAFGDTLAAMKLSLRGTVGTMLGVFLPGLQRFADGAKGYMQQFSDVVVGANGDTTKMAAGIGDLLGQLVSSLGKKLPGMMDAGLGILQGIINAIMKNVPVLLPAVVQIITALIKFLVQNIVLLTPAAVQLVTSLVVAIVNMLPMLTTAAMQILIALAQGLTTAMPVLIPAIMEIVPRIIMILVQNLPMLILTGLSLMMSVVQGFVAAIPLLVPEIPKIITEIVTILMQKLPIIITSAMNIILALAQGLISALPLLIPEIPKIITQIVTLIIQNLPLLIVAAVQIILTLAMALIENIPMILKAVADIIKGIIDAFKKTDWKTIGDNIIDGVKTGFMNKWTSFKTSIGTKFKELWSYIKGLLGIHSPSTLFAGIGMNMAAGMGVGFEDQMKAVQRQVRGAVSSLSGSGFGGLSINARMQPAVAVAAPATPINVYVTAKNEIDYYRMAQRVADEMKKRK